MSSIKGLMTIRPAEDEDIPAMAHIRSQEWGDLAYWMERITGYKHCRLSPQRALPERAIFVAVEGEYIVGFVAGHRTQRLSCDGELEWINVAAHRRGKGIADRLIERMGVWFLEQNAHRICVNADKDNVIARRVYTRCGAKPLNDHWMVWEDAQSMRGR
ncbi:MAG TPA: GNAT family N-acetyltransferase [Acidobacteriaceae bacterium]